MHPHDVSLRIELATSLRCAEEHDAALATLGHALELDLDDAQRLELLTARAGMHRGNDNDAALSDLEEAFALDAAQVAPQLEELLQHERTEAASSGDAHHERDITMRCIDVMMAQGKSDEASDLLRTWVEQTNDDVEALRRLRQVDANGGDWPAVVATCQRLVALEEGAAQVEAVMALCHAYREIGTPELARGELEAVLEAQPDNPNLRAELRQIYEQTGDQAQLAVMLIDDANAIEDDEEHREMLLRAGRIYIELGDAASAVPPLRAALELDTSRSEVVLALADAFMLAGWYDDATELLDDVIASSRGRRTPELSNYHHRKAQVAAALGDQEGQLASLKEAHNCSKKNGYVAAELAQLAEEVGDWDLAVKTLRTITLIDTPCPVSRGEAFFRQGKIALHQGDQKGARMWGRRAQREDPESEEIATFLEQLEERLSVPPRRP